MTDVVDRKTRSRMMAGIRAANTKPEIIVRRMLHFRGFRYRLHGKDLPGKPDLVLPKYRSVVFVHGCFWHCHGCHLFKWPKSREKFWEDKLTGNKQRDQKAIENLITAGWRVLVIWECGLKGVSAESLTRLIDQAESFLESTEMYMELPDRQS